MMFTENGFKKRRTLLWSHVPERIEWIILGNPKHIYYMCGFMINPVSLSAGERSFLLMKREDEAVLIADNLSLLSSETEYYVDDVESIKWYDQSHAVKDRTFMVSSALNEKTKNISSEKIYSEKEWLPSFIKSAENQQVSISAIILNLRRTKDADEIELIRLIAKAATAGHERARDIIRPGIKEIDIYREVNNAVIKELGHPAIIYGDFRAVNSSLPKCGGAPTNYKCKSGDLFILDYSILFHGYRTDCTNTIAVGSAGDSQRMFFDVCMEALEKTEKLLVPGNKTKDVFFAMYEIFKEHNMQNEFGFHAGHGIGMSHPEAPCFGPDSDETLMEGEVVTLEPGAYKQGVGGVRLERNFLVAGNSPEILTDHILSL